jgi:hypothetical protein
VENNKFTLSKCDLLLFRDLVRCIYLDSIADVRNKTTGIEAEEVPSLWALYILRSGIKDTRSKNRVVNALTSGSTSKLLSLIWSIQKNLIPVTQTRRKIQNPSWPSFTPCSTRKIHLYTRKMNWTPKNIFWKTCSTAIRYSIRACKFWFVLPGTRNVRGVLRG